MTAPSCGRRCGGFCHRRHCIRRWLGTVKIAAINERRARVGHGEQNDKRNQRQPSLANDVGERLSKHRALALNRDPLVARARIGHCLDHPHVANAILEIGMRAHTAL